MNARFAISFILSFSFILCNEVLCYNDNQAERIEWKPSSLIASSTTDDSVQILVEGISHFKERIAIKSVKSDCSCLNLNFPPNPIDPGGSVKIQGTGKLSANTQVSNRTLVLILENGHSQIIPLKLKSEAGILIDQKFISWTDSSDFAQQRVRVIFKPEYRPYTIGYNKLNLEIDDVPGSKPDERIFLVKPRSSWHAGLQEVKIAPIDSRKKTASLSLFLTRSKTIQPNK